MLIKILVVLTDGRVLECQDTEEMGVLEHMIDLTDKHDFTNTVWITKEGFAELKSKKETLRWIREEY